MLVQKEDVDNVPFDVAVIRERRKVIVHFCVFSRPNRVMFEIFQCLNGNTWLDIF